MPLVKRTRGERPAQMENKGCLGVILRLLLAVLGMMLVGSVLSEVTLPWLLERLVIGITFAAGGIWVGNALVKATAPRSEKEQTKDQPDAGER